MKRRLLEDVLPDLDVSLPANDDDPTFRIVFEYATGGLLALMAAAGSLAPTAANTATDAVVGVLRALSGLDRIQTHFVILSIIRRARGTQPC